MKSKRLNYKERMNLITKQNHIVVLPSWYALDKGGIKGSFFREQARALAKKGYKVSIVYFGIEKKRDKRAYVDDGVNVYITSGKSIGPLSIIKIWLKTFQMIWRINKKDSIDLIHVQSFFIGMSAVLFKLLKKTPYIVTEHSSIFLEGKLRISSKICASLVYKYASKVICVSKNLGNFVSKYTNHKIEVIHNMVDGAFFKAKRNNNTDYSSTFYSCGNLIKSKGFMELLSICKNLKNDGYMFKVIVSGDGPERDELEQFVRDNGLDEYILFTGVVSREQVVTYMANSDCFILLTKYETFGLVFAEASAVGTPIIMPNIPVSKELINDINGVAVDINKIEKIAETMRKIMNHELTYDSAVIRERCFEQFSESVFVNKYDALIKSVIENSCLQKNSWKSA